MTLASCIIAWSKYIIVNATLYTSLESHLLSLSHRHLLIYTLKPSTSITMSLNRRDVAFPTVDGITLKGWFFPASDRHGPCVIMTPGVCLSWTQYSFRCPSSILDAVLLLTLVHL